VGKETKFGLLVGVVFIVLFGVILGGRVGTSAHEHAPLPVGDSRGYDVIADAIGEAVDPFREGARPLMLDDPSSPGRPGRVRPAVDAPAEEPLPLPDTPAPDADDGPAPAPPVPAPAESDTVGRLAFGPARVRTPMPPPVPEDPGPPAPATDEPARGRDAAPPADGPAPAAPPRQVHVVAKGDTLTTIANLYYGPEDGPRLWRRIWEANKATLPDPDRLVLDQELVIPGVPVAPQPEVTQVARSDEADGHAAEAPTETVRSVGLTDLADRFHVRLDLTDPAPSGPAAYTVRKGDTFYSIARELYGDERLGKDLAKANAKTVSDPRKLRVGQELVLLRNVKPVSQTDPGSGTVVAQR